MNEKHLQRMLQRGQKHMLIKNDWEQQFSIERLTEILTKLKASKEIRQTLITSQEITGPTAQGKANIDQRTVEIETAISNFRNEWYPAIDSLSVTYAELRASIKMLDSVVKEYKQRVDNIEQALIIASAIIGDERVAIKTEQGTFSSETRTYYTPGSPVIIANDIVKRFLKDELNVDLDANPQAQQLIYAVSEKVVSLFTKTMRKEALTAFVEDKLKDIPEDDKLSILDAFHITSYEANIVKFKSK